MLKVMDYSKQIAELIKNRLNWLRLSQREFALLVGVPEPVVTKWLKGNHNFTIKTIANIETALNFKLINEKKESINNSIRCFPCVKKITVTGKIIFDNYAIN